MRNLLLLLIAATTLIACSAGNSNTTQPPVIESQPIESTPPTLVTTPMAFITERNKDILTCDVTESGFTNCLPNTLTGVNFADVMAVVKHPTLNIAYVTDSAGNAVYKCEIYLYSDAPGQLTNCTKVVALVPPVIASPRAVTFNADASLAYIPNDDKYNPSMAVCNVNESGFFTACTNNTPQEALSAHPTSAAFNPINGEVLVSIWGGSQPANCVSTGDNRLVMDCSLLTLNDSYRFWAAIQIIVSPNNQFVYVTNYGANFVSICALNQTTGGVENCQNSIRVLQTTPYGVYAIAINPDNNIAYVSNYDKSAISACDITESGIFAQCTQLPGEFIRPSYIELFNYPQESKSYISLPK